MGGIGFSEILVVAVVALVVADPKDIPALMRRLGRWKAHMAHLRAQLAAELAAMDQDIHDAGRPHAFPSAPPPPPAAQDPATPTAQGPDHG